jgi:heptosyltransferase I
VLRRLQDAWPATRFTWVIGRFEQRLMSLLPDVEFISYDKKGGLAEIRRLRGVLAARRFDVLLHMQVALRASLVSTLVRAPLRLGFDLRRGRELQWLFTNARIQDRGDEHVLDGLMGFADALGAPAGPPRWDVPLPPGALAYAERLVPDTRPTLLVSPCSSHALRNWRPERYAAAADHAAEIHGMRVILCGGPGPVERAMADAILGHVRTPVLDQVGKDTLPQLLALMARATAIVTPDSGPAHMATLVGLPVIGLYAATNPARSGPYLSRAHCVDRYADAARSFLGQEPGDLAWTTKIEKPGVMDLITTDDVRARLDALLAGLAR